MADPAPGSVWTRPRPTPRRQAPGVDRFVAQAVAVADAEGLEAVSMRRVAGDLGSGTASLYRHLAGREELVELMVDAVLGEDPVPAPTGDWRADLGGVAHALRAGMLRHPWLPGELAGRPTLGPHSLRRSDTALAAAAGLTSDITTVSRVVGLLHAYVLGSVTAELAAWRARQRTGLTDEQWQHSVGPYIRAVIEAGDHPMLARRVLEAEETDPDDDFAFGLACVLDGLAAQVGSGV